MLAELEVRPSEQGSGLHLSTFESPGRGDRIAANSHLWLLPDHSIAPTGTCRYGWWCRRPRSGCLHGWQKGSLFDAVQGNVPEWEAGRWYHVAVTVSGREVSLYRDGMPLISRSTGQRISSQSLVPCDLDGLTEAYIGRLPSNHNHKPQRLGGQIDDVQFYGRALDEKAIRYMFENSGNVFPAIPSN